MRLNLVGLFGVNTKICRAVGVGLFFVLVLVQPGCFWKKDKAPEERVYDIYGTVKSVTQERLVIDSKQGELEFNFVDSSIKGSEFGQGAYVHVYYKTKENEKEITMVVEKLG